MSELNSKKQEAIDLRLKLEQQEIEIKKHLADLVGLSRDEATKRNMSMGFHTQVYRAGDFLQENFVPNRVRMRLNSNNIVELAHRG